MRVGFWRAEPWPFGQFRPLAPQPWPFEQVRINATAPDAPFKPFSPEIEEMRKEIAELKAEIRRLRNEQQR